MLFGLQMFLKKALDDFWPLSYFDIDEAKYNLTRHGEPFDPEPWNYLVDEHGGHLPITIYAVPEGLPMPSRLPLVRIECEDPKLFWLPMFLETDLQRAVWYPSSVASQDHANYLVIRRHWNDTCDNLDLMRFALHDFGGRGVTCSEQAEIGGAAHLVHFDGSDTLEGILAANQYYNTEMAAFSVPASEHSVQCAWGPAYQSQYLEHVLDTYAKEGAIVSIVIDGYDTMREAATLCTQFGDKIKQSKARIVFRPDSGDPRHIVPEILKMQARVFGTTPTKKGYHVVNNVGVIQGDGIDTQMIDEILSAVADAQFAACNVVFGSGGALLQKHNRDMFGFAQKASAIKRFGSWQGIYKDPVTDIAKASKAGRLATYQSRMNNEFICSALDPSEMDSEWAPVMRKVFENGELFINEPLETIRARART
jgi:nicotinamide phosphoribosyltransferase